MSRRNDQSSGEEQDYIVEKILDKRIKSNKVQYFLKWKGYPDTDNTWEPVDHLEDCKDLIREFEDKLKKKQEEQQVEKRAEMKTTPAGAPVAEGKRKKITSGASSETGSTTSASGTKKTQGGHWKGGI